MFSIKRTKDTDDLVKMLSLLREYFEPYEIVSSNEFIYYVGNYSKLYDGEDYFAYKIESSETLVGMMSGVKLKEFVSIDYLVIRKEYRRYTKEIASKLFKILNEFKLPIILEAETEALCRLYRSQGFKQFSEHYQYVMLQVDLVNKTSKTLIHDSHLMYLSNTLLDFEQTRDTLYRKHYYRWNSIYGEQYLTEYKKALGL